MTCENDIPGRFRRARSSYASRSTVIVLTAMRGSCTDGRGRTRVVEAGRSGFGGPASGVTSSRGAPLRGGEGGGGEVAPLRELRHEEGGGDEALGEREGGAGVGERLGGLVGREAAAEEDRDPREGVGLAEEAAARGALGEAGRGPGGAVRGEELLVRDGAAQRWRGRGSGSPWRTRSWTRGKSLFCTSGRQRETSSTRTDSASQTVAGVWT